MYVLDELWEGRITPLEKTFYADPAYQEAARRVSDTGTRLWDSLDPQQRQLLEAAQDAEDELYTVAGRNMFYYAFSLGAKLILDIIRISNI